MGYLNTEQLTKHQFGTRTISLKQGCLCLLPQTWDILYQSRKGKKIAFPVEATSFPKYNISRDAIKIRVYIVNKLNLKCFLLHNTILTSIYLVPVKKTKFFEDLNHHNKT